MMLCTPTVSAQHRSIEDAKRIASNFNQRLKHVRGKNERSEFVPKYNHKISNAPCYVFTLYHKENSISEGFVLVSDDERLPEVLGYSDVGTFPQEKIPCNVKEWLNGLEYLATCSLALANSSGGVAVYNQPEKDVSPLLKETRWNQDAPYNNNCPTYNGMRSCTGCVATALSQIMRVHRWPDHGCGGVSYLTETRKLNVEFDFDNTFFDWDNMLDKYTIFSKEYEKQAVAELMYAVGAAVGMDYYCDVKGQSGASDKDVVEGMCKYLRYDSDMSMVDTDMCDEFFWHQTLQQELLEGRPVYYSGGQHAYVIDGMRAESDGQEYYHVNWGWGGAYDGYFLLNHLCPEDVGLGAVSGTNFGLSPHMIIGIKPEDNVENNRLLCSGMQAKVGDVFPGQVFSAKINKMSVMSSYDFEGSFRIELLPVDSGQSSTVCVYEESTRKISVNRGLTNYNVRCEVPTDTPPGEYQMIITCKNLQGEDMKIIHPEYPKIRINNLDDWESGGQITPSQYLSMQEACLYPLSNGNIRINLSTIKNIRQYQSVGKLSVLLMDNKGQIVNEISDRIDISVGGFAQVRNLMFDAVLPSSLPDGKYEIRIGFLPEDGDMWSFVYNTPIDQDEWFCTFELFGFSMDVNERTVNLDGYEFDLPSSIDVPIEKNVPYSSNITTLSGLKVKKGECLNKGIYIYTINGRCIKVLK